MKDKSAEYANVVGKVLFLDGSVLRSALVTALHKVKILGVPSFLRFKISPNIYLRI